VPTLSEDRQSAAIPPGCTLVDHGHGGSGGDYSVADPGATIADGRDDVFDAVRAARPHAVGEPMATSEPTHTDSLPACCTLADPCYLRRQVFASARPADVRVLGTDVGASLTDRLADIELNFHQRCEGNEAGESVADQIAAEGDSTARYPFAFGVLDAAVWLLLTTWDIYADASTSHRLEQVGRDIVHLADVLKGCREGLER
jgi:hypothetical protein